MGTRETGIIEKLLVKLIRHQQVVPTFLAEIFAALVRIYPML